MSKLDEGLQVLRLAAERGNEPAKAVVAHVAELEGRLRNQAEINTELNAQLRDLRLKVLQGPAGWNNLFNGDFQPGVTQAMTVKEGDL